ncbi:MAG: DUF5063 domain-containing protein [Tannerellaceae bacterium]|jgi:hypothetical protein|nr:DUF5063 domain-containing protein [Tannerellaceae bacterium]
MSSNNNIIYDHNAIEFMTVALEYCSFVEAAKTYSLFDFIDKATKILPLLYLKASLLPDIPTDDDIEPAIEVTESMYESLRTHIADILGVYDSYLETFHTDMQYSDTPIAAFISENLADIYQDTGNFVSVYRQRHEILMYEAIAVCRNNFCKYWGQQLLNAMKALHAVRYNEDDDIEMHTTE